MKLGLIGKPLGHSISPQIHKQLINEEYVLYELDAEEVVAFLKKKDFDGINVTIPYKEFILDYVDEISEEVKEIGASNCIVNQNGKLVAYNTDVYGFQEMLVRNNIDVKDKNVAILGSGGASKACKYAIKQMGGIPQVVSRGNASECITYDALEKNKSMYQVIVNTTPVGMYPNMDEAPITLNGYTFLEALIDIIANPLQTKLMFEAKTKGIKTCGGFEMLVRQAAHADKRFVNVEVDEEKVQSCLYTLKEEIQNIILIGMPTSGKSTIAKELANRLHMNCVDMDQEIEKRMGISIKECFETKGEEEFRKYEKDIAKEIREYKHTVVSCGGGVIKDATTMQYLSTNGIVVWIDRDLNLLFESDSRPLSSTKEDLNRLYEERYPLYQKYSDIHVCNNTTITEVIDEIIKKGKDK